MYVKTSDIQVGDSVLFWREIISKATPCEAEPMAALSWGPWLAFRKSNSNPWKTHKSGSVQNGHGACQWSTTMKAGENTGHLLQSRATKLQKNYNRDGSQWVHPCRHSIAGKVQEGELRKNERHQIHRGIFKGKVLRLPALVLRVANSCQARKGSGSCMLLRCLFVFIT